MKKNMSKDENSSWHKKIAKNRQNWKTKMMQGKIEHATHPTILRMKRLSKGLSQSDMANKLGIKATTYGYYERAHIAVNKNMAEKIASILSMKVNELFVPNKNKKKYLAKKQG